MGERNCRTGYLVLGTAQLGQPYGVANRTGMPSEADAVALVLGALDAGIGHIDTARAYGDSERRIGLALAQSPAGRPEVTTKLDPLLDIDHDQSPEVAAEAACRSLAMSRAALGRERLDAVLLHRAYHRTAWEGAVWDVLCRERDAGRIGRIGVSVETPGEAQAAVADPQVAQIQIPFNILDHRWADAGVTEALRRRSDIVVHVRSVFLQGLLAGGDGGDWPSFDGFDAVKLVAELRSLAQDLGRSGLADLCIAYARAQTWVDGILIGMETPGQLATNLAIFEEPVLMPDQAAAVVATVPRLPEAILNPARWPKN